MHRAFLLIALTTGCHSGTIPIDEPGGLHAHCASICRARQVDETVSSWCAIDLEASNSVRGCTEVCEQIGSDGPMATEGVTTCIADNPVCYDTIESCALREAHPVASPIQIEISGENLDLYEGLTAWCSVDPWNAENASIAPHSAVVTDGRLRFSWMSEPIDMGYVPPSLAFYIDLDGDNLCDPTLDLAGQMWTATILNYETPLLSYELDPASSSSSCVGFAPPE